MIYTFEDTPQLHKVEQCTLNDLYNKVVFVKHIEDYIVLIKRYEKIIILKWGI